MSRSHNSRMMRWLAVDESVSRRLAVQDVIAPARLPRLAEALASSEGQLRIDLEFGADDRGRPRVTGAISWELSLQCQRCLGAFPWNGEQRVDWRLARSEAEETELLKEFEPVRVEDDRLELQDAIEDEVMLAIPLVPICGPDCSAPAH